MTAMPLDEPKTSLKTRNDLLFDNFKAVRRIISTTIGQKSRQIAFEKEMATFFRQVRRKLRSTNRVSGMFQITAECPYNSIGVCFARGQAKPEIEQIAAFSTLI